MSWEQLMDKVHRKIATFYINIPESEGFSSLNPLQYTCSNKLSIKEAQK